MKFAPNQRPLIMFLLPAADRAKLELWEACALRLCGGWTRDNMSVCGAWVDPAGTIIKEPMIRYWVAAPPRERAILRANAVDLWPEEQAFFIAHVGQAAISTPRR